jgi:hypothetical protein
MSAPNDHNQTGLLPEERAAIEIDAALEAPRARWLEIQAGIERAPEKIEDETTAEKFTTLIAQLQALLKRIDRAHDDAKEPWLAAGRKVDAVSNVLYSTVDEKSRQMQARLTAYQVAKQAAIDAERKRLRDLEAADPEPAVVNLVQQDRARTRVRSVEGASAHLVEQVSVKILDVKKIPKRYLTRPKVLAAIMAELLPDIRKGDTIAGAERVGELQSRVKA